MLLRRFESLLHTLQLYGAAGIVAFGWAMCVLCGWDALPWMPLWFCSALLVYNIDRLRRDPADAHNTPLRAASAERLRSVSKTLATLAALVLIALPVWRRDWLTLGLVLGGAFVSVQYSVPLLGLRLKDVPFLKSFIAPSMVAAAVFGLPWLHAGGRPGALLAVVWAWSYLEFNMILCDLRDIDGDRQHGVASLPVRLGVSGTRWVLFGLVIATVIVAAINTYLTLGSTPTELCRGTTWLLFSLLIPTLALRLLFASYRPQTEQFYERYVEGLLFLPAFVVGLTYGMFSLTAFTQSH